MIQLQILAQPLPPDSAYVVVDENGHLSLNGERQRYWAVIGKPFIHVGGDLEKSRKGTDALVERFENLGFNAVRLWNVNGGRSGYEIGDGSSADAVDYLICKLGEKGFNVWSAGLGNRVGYMAESDVDLVDDPETSEAWKAAIKEYNEPAFEHKGDFKRRDIRHSLARIWDPRIEAAYIERMRENATHLNKHTGLRWSDDPTFAVWELTNEEWWMRRMVGGGWTKEPKFFRDQLIAKWNEWLRSKYGTDEALKTAWGGVLPGESLESDSVLLAPMAGKSDPNLSMNDSNPAARDALTGMEQTYTRDDFNDERGGDVLSFFLEIQLAHKQRAAAAVKTFGKSCALSPTVYDTGIGYEIHSQFIHQNADAVSHDAYVNGWGPRYEEPDLSAAKNENRKMLMQLDKERISANEGPWVNWLLKPPGISQGVPWLEHNKVEGKPFLVYETQIQQPAKYRADFPLRLAALASIQDWDWISWHYFSPHEDVGTEETPFNRALDVTAGSHPQGYHFTYDEVQNAIMRQAALIWRNETLDAPETPTTFIWGAKSLRDPDSMDYAGSYGVKGFDMLQTVYQYGVRIEIDPSREDDEVIGPVVSFAERKTHNPYTPTPAITFDWKKGYLMFDDPQSIAFTGMLASYGEEVAFENGFVLRNVEIHNPEGMFDPVTNGYIAFAMTAEDRKPLSESEDISLSLMSTSFNSGFEMDTGLLLDKGQPRYAKTKAGGLPVLVARVGATLEAPALRGMSYRFLDWHFNEIGSGTLEEGVLNIPPDLPVSIIKLTR
ncbi:MAG: hypothetical protein WD708_07620 [Kiritimatiellia bacterium]